MWFMKADVYLVREASVCGHSSSPSYSRLSGWSQRRLIFISEEEGQAVSWTNQTLLSYVLHKPQTYNWVGFFLGKGPGWLVGLFDDKMIRESSPESSALQN